MTDTRTIRVLLMTIVLSAGAAAQVQSQPEAAPAPAFGQQSAPILSPENPPVSGVDEPALELHTANRSFVSPALEVSETADTNGNNALGNRSDMTSISRVVGAFDLQQFWPKSDLFLEYVGGGAFYSNPFEVKQIHAAGLEAVTRWRTGQMTLRDSFTYLPDGSFNVGFGGMPGFGIATGNGFSGTVPGSHSFGSGALGAIGDTPRLANTAILDAVQAVTPVSAITMVGAFSNAHFYDPTNNLLNSDQITTQAGYARLVSRHDQVGVVYAFQLFQFPQNSGGQVFNHIVNVRWSHTISGRMSVTAGAGPQYTDLQLGGSFPHWSVSGRVQLHYKFAHSSMVASYEKYTSAGSGFFAGAETQAARLGYTRPLGRTWEFYGDMGYSHDKKLQNTQTGGFAAGAYDEGSVIAVVRKHIGRTYEFFTAYRFSEIGFNGNVSAGGGNTGSISQRQSATIGIEWHPTPTRIE